MSATAAPPDLICDAEPWWRGMARRGLRNQVLCLVIALAIWWLGPKQTGFVVAWIYSVAIGNCCWLFIDGGRQLVAQWVNRNRPDIGEGWAHWPGALWMLACILVGTVAGYSLGGEIGDRLTGHVTPSLLANVPALALSLIAAVGASYFFYSSERLRQEQAAADAARRLAAEHQLKLLESQLEPHMMFNTLANLRVLIGIDPPRAQAMLDRLIAFLRATLGASRSGAHPLAAEFERLADYLALMAVRMGPRLQVEFELPDALRTLPVPPLLLQPLVENSIKHGLEPKIEGGRIRVSAQRDGDRLLLQVRDTGIGLEAAAGAAAGSGFGTAQVRERLAALYGERARFDLLPAADAEGGCLARIELPLAAPHASP